VAKLSSPGDLPDIVRHDVSPENIKSLVGAGHGASLMCEASMGASYARVVYREARDGNGSTRIGYRAHWREGNDNGALRNFIRHLKERCPPVTSGSGPYGGVSRTPDLSP
jgi:DNA-binding transcriptional LysR family regulator